MRRPLFMVCLLVVSLLGLGLLWQEQKGGLPPDGEPDRVDRQICCQEWDGQEVLVFGEIYRKEPECIYLKSISMQNDAANLQQIIPFSKNIICECENAEKLLLGSKVIVQGELAFFSHATNPGEFDAADYYGAMDIGGKLKKAQLLKQGEAYSVLAEGLYAVRSYLKQRICYVFPEKEASVMCAMLLGDKEKLDKEIKELYQRNGIVHILSISGLHITVIGMGVYKGMRRLGIPVWISATVGGVLLLLYGLLTGMSVSACRAIGMYLLRMLAEIVGRSYDMLTALGGMLLIMVLTQVRYLQSAGFLLSFGAVLSLGILGPVLTKKGVKAGKRLRDKVWYTIKQTFLSTLSVTLGTLPIQLWFFYQVPVFAIFLNLFILPCMSLLMVSGLIAMLLPGTGILATVSCLLLRGYEWLCKGFDAIPYHTWTPGKPHVWQMLGSYLLLAGVVLLSKCRGTVCKEHKAGLLQFLMLTFSVILLGINIPRENIVTFLDVGQGDCICVETIQGEVYLFDCGSSSRKQVGKYVLLPYLKYEGITHIDAFFVSHPDGDHCSGLLEWLQEGEDWGIIVDAIVLPDIDESKRKADFETLLRAVEETNQRSQVAIRYIKQGDYWQDGENFFYCLHPSGQSEGLEANAYSECFYIALGQRGTTMLLTGDVEKEGEDMLLKTLQEKNITQVDILKVAHHGSKYSTSEELLEQLQPNIAVISAGRRNRYGHPHEEVLERLQDMGCTILQTSEEGAVRFLLQH